MRKIMWLGLGLIIGCIASVIGVALADIQYTQGAGTTLFDFVCFSGKHCPAHVPINSSGTELMTAVNPAIVSISGGDPCFAGAKTNFAISSNVGNTQVVTGVGGKRVYICSISLVAASAAVVSFVEGAGAACGTAELAIIGSTTAANGLSLLGNGGFTLGNGIGTVGLTSNTANGICLVQSGTALLSGNLTYVQQ